jgi:hypothetical protein
MKQVLKTIGFLMGVGCGTLFGQLAPQFFLRELPSELSSSSFIFGKTQPHILERLQLGELHMHSLGKQGGLTMDLAGARPLAFSGMPKVPQLLRVFKVNPGQKAKAVLENVVVEETLESVNLPKVPEAHVWSLKKSLKFKSPTMGRYFPGDLVKSHQVKGRLYVNLFPVQIDLLTGKVLKITSAEIKLAYSEKPLTLSLGALETKPSIIVTSAKMKLAAEKLKNYHEEKLGIKTAIVTVEEIKDLEQPIAEESLPEGYKTTSQRDNAVKPYQPQKNEGYDYELAKRIANYLQKRMGEGSSLKYVTLLGNVQEIPPSYYFAYHDESNRNFTPTDACYGAIDKCGEPRVAVGRLPLNNEREVDQYITKVEEWRIFSNESSKELSLYGGKAFPQSDVYVGELGTLNTIQDKNLDWQGVVKNFKTQSRYAKATLKQAVLGAPQTPFAYHLDHGNGNEWYVEREFITSNEISGGRISSTDIRSSVIVSVSCSNAAFDESLFNEAVFDEPSHGGLSIGSSLIRARGGAVAYLGSARPAVGDPIYQFDEFGNLELTGTNYSLQILDSFFQRYGISRRGRMGDFTLKALQGFIFENGNTMSEEKNQWSYFTTALLGDPVIPLPDRTKSAEVFETSKSALKLDNSLGFGLSVLKLENFSSDNIPLEIIHSVEASLYKIQENDFGGYEGENRILSQKVSDIEHPQLNLEKALTAGKYFLRLENSEGVPRERQVYFLVE